jgi:beta-lactamase class D
VILQIHICSTILLEIRQQNLPVTIKYPEMVAEIFPYFDGYEFPYFGKDNLWFL